MKKRRILLLALFSFAFTNQELAAQPAFSPADPEYYAMDREHI